MTEKVSRGEAFFSVGLLPISVIVASVFGWLTIKVSPYYVAGLVLPMVLVGLSCAGLRVLRGKEPVNP